MQTVSFLTIHLDSFISRITKCTDIIMREKVKRILRDVPSSILLMVGFGLTLFITMVCCGLVKDILNSKKKNADNSLTYYYLNLYHTDRVIENYENGTLSYAEEESERIQFEPIYKIMEKYNVNFYSGEFVYIGEGQEQQRKATVIYHFDKTLPFSLESGYVDWDEDEYTVVIGESIKPFVIQRENEDYLYVDGEYYKVTGIAKNYGSGGYDSSIYLLADKNGLKNVQEKVSKELISDIMVGFSREITAYSNNPKIVENINAAKKELENNYPLHIDIESESAEGMTESDVMNFLYENLNKFFMPILLFFSIGSCYSITSLWIKVRKTDIAVKITYGYGKAQIYKWILKELSILLGISLVISLMTRAIYMAVYGELHLLVENVGYDVLIIAGAMCITLFVTSLGAYKYSKEIIPAEVLKEL